ncbi:MAG: hypothetical protein CM15mP65_29550 [Crocinitomicaceae bacterium]|nr:MAG: hypothetical protein CM15mP65_29550 [Crocinitomicaceae bacterium]
MIFTYERNAPLLYYEGQHVNNLADIFAFYIYVVLGYDYDSFAFEGGTPYFNKADQIVSICQNGGEPGWKAGIAIIIDFGSFKIYYSLNLHH